MRSGYRLAGTQRALVPLSGPYRDLLGSTHRFVEVSGSGLTNATFATVAIVRTRDDQVRQMPPALHEWRVGPGTTRPP